VDNDKLLIEYLDKLTGFVEVEFSSTKTTDAVEEAIVLVTKELNERLGLES
jgi:hypothetical protein